MHIARTRPELEAARAKLLADAGSFALVPTMGALHAGHLALLDAGRRHCGAVAASIFVNPMQFAAGEDLARYPRDEAGDLDKLERAGCALVWMPSVDDMYPLGDATRVVVDGPARAGVGAMRAGHFTGVAPVVLKLLLQLRAEAAMFGEKNWQQLQVVRRMAADLAVPTRIVGVPTMREADGLALSSRNRFLSDDERRNAPALFACLTDAALRLTGGDALADVLRHVAQVLAQRGFVVDYVELVDAESLQLG